MWRRRKVARGQRRNVSEARGPWDTRPEKRRALKGREDTMLISPRAPSGRGASCVVRDQGLWLAHARRPLATFSVPLAGHARLASVPCLRRTDVKLVEFPTICLLCASSVSSVPAVVSCRDIRSNLMFDSFRQSQGHQGLTGHDPVVNSERPSRYATRLCESSDAEGATSHARGSHQSRSVRLSASRRSQQVCESAGRT